ncbi:MAG: hypothetical protein ACRD1T_13985, partial [Acidimicrobiia bacterium]
AVRRTTAIINKKRVKVVDFLSPSGRWVRFTAGGRFVGFRQPPPGFVPPLPGKLPRFRPE